jgi:hypothetical protein
MWFRIDFRIQECTHSVAKSLHTSRSFCVDEHRDSILSRILACGLHMDQSVGLVCLLLLQNLTRLHVAWLCCCLTGSWTENTAESLVSRCCIDHAFNYCLCGLGQLCSASEIVPEVTPSYRGSLI